LPIRTTIAFASLAFSIGVAGCGDSTTDSQGEPLFPADVEVSYSEVRDCRRSADHDLNHVRIVVNDVALGPYMERDRLFPQGASIVKLEYADPECTDLVGFTSMVRDALATDRGPGDWVWQRVDADRRVERSGALTDCILCHQSCGVPPEGHDWTCAVP
jgi:hypothetical protein